MVARMPLTTSKQQNGRQSKLRIEAVLKYAVASEVRQKYDQVYPLHTMKLLRTWCIQLLQRMALYRTVLNCRCVYMFPIVHDVLNHLNHFFFGRLLMTCFRLYAILFVSLAQSAPLKGSAGKFARQLHS